MTTSTHSHKAWTDEGGHVIGAADCGQRALLEQPERQGVQLDQVVIAETVHGQGWWAEDSGGDAWDVRSIGLCDTRTMTTSHPTII